MHMPRLSRALLCLLLPLAARAAESTFTIAVIPDAQQEVLDARDTRLANRFEWLVQNRKDLNLKMVMQVGDLLNWDTPDHIQYERASKALEILDKAKLPYALTIGNHDSAATKEGGSAAPGNVHDNLRTTTTFNTYFPTKRFRALESTYEKDKIDTACHAFKAGGLNWLVINLELWARKEPVDWARKVIEQHPDHNIIILTHSHLNGDGSINQRNGGYGDNSPQYVFDRLMKPYSNVRLVFSGHTGRHAYRTDQGEHGNTIYQFCQCYHSNDTNPVRLFEIDTRKGTLRTWVHCPSQGKDLEDGSRKEITGIKWVEPTAKR
jgi:DNA repair exonuclease SbcCD nuclease subunit